MKKNVKLILIALIVLFIIGFGIGFLSPKKSMVNNNNTYTLGNSHGNIVNDGLVAEYKGLIYFSNTMDNGKLYSMSEKGEEKKKITDDKALFINIIDDCIYYRNESDGGKIYKIKTNGKERTKLNEDSSLYINLSGNYLYYSNESKGNRLYKVDINGKNNKKLSNDSASFINLCGNWIYYSCESDGNKLYKLDTAGEKRTLISNDMCYFINIVGDWIYYSNYTDGFSLSKMKLDGSSKKVLDKNSSHSLNVLGDWIYFNCTDNNYGESGLYKIKTDGTSKERLINQFSDKIQLAFDWVFYINSFDKDNIYRVKTDGSMRQNNDGTTVVRSVFDLNNALLGKIDFEIKEDKLILAYDKAKEIVKSLIKPGMSELEKELVLHNYIITNTKYDVENYSKDIITLDASSSYGILVKGVGVCGGYAESMQLLLNLAGVECHWIAGEAGTPGNTGLHAWNIVKIDGEYYQLDPTWDDPVPDLGNRIILNYFNISDDEISKDHKWNKSLYKSCKSKRFSYLRDMDQVIYKDGWIYYSSISDDFKLYKISIDGKNKKKISDDSVNYLSIYDDYIYYSNYSYGGYLFKISLDGKDIFQLNETLSEDIQVKGDWIFYKTKSGTYKMKGDGSNNQKVK